MKKSFVLGVIWILALCALAQAQSVTANVSYVGSNNSRIAWLDSNGLSLELLGAVDGIGDVVLSARHQRTTAESVGSFSIHSRYTELSGQFLVPRFNHSIIAGVGTLTLDSDGVTEFRGSQVLRGDTTKFLMPVVGLGGWQRLGDAVFNYSWRLFPRASRTYSGYLADESQKWTQNPSTGTELRGSVTHMIRPRVGFGGEVYWRRFAKDTRDTGFKVGTTLVVFK